MICANSSSLPEVAGDGALLFDPRNVEELTYAMRRTLTDSALRDELVSRGRRNLQRFSWRACAQQVIGVLEQAVTVQ